MNFSLNDDAQPMEPSKPVQPYVPLNQRLEELISKHGLTEFLIAAKSGYGELICNNLTDTTDRFTEHFNKLIELSCSLPIATPEHD